MKKKLIIVSILVLVLATVGYFKFLRSAPNKYDFRFDNVTKGEITTYVTATGTINAVTSVDVGTQVSGIISKLYADFNSVVKKGDVIAQIDSTFLVQSVKDAEASLEKSKAQLEDSKRNLDREKAMLEKGLDSQLNYDAALTTYATNTASFKSAQASLDRAKINLEYATIYAPINGVVINRAVNVGQTVAASFSSPTLYTIANDMSKMQVLTTVDESDIGRISIAQGATFTVDAYPDETFKGTVSQIRLAPVTVQNVVNYTVVIDVNNAQLKLMPGMTANVKILVASAHDVLRVTNMALRFQPPADVIDSSKLNALRQTFATRGSSGADSPAVGTLAAIHPDPSGKDPNPSQGSGVNGGRARFQAVRDSIVSAHGGTISQEDLRSAVQAIFGGGGGARKESSPAVAQPLVKPPKGTTFGITQRFPEYEKSAYVPQHEVGRARIWILNSNGKLEPVFVRTGVTDGKYTEISSSDLKAGDQIIMGVMNNANVTSTQTQNPLTGGGQQRPGGGGGFR
jgi:HlyD family secretion protein